MLVFFNASLYCPDDSLITRNIISYILLCVFVKLSQVNIMNRFTNEAGLERMEKKKRGIEHS
jgi:hypothetical protein